MNLNLTLNRFKVLRFLLVLLSFCTVVVSSANLQCAIFIDIDEFNFIKSGIKSGLRISAFDSETQKYSSINYYSFSTTASRKPTGDLLSDFYGLRIDYNGNVTFSSPLNDTIVRTKGEFYSNLNGLQIFKDDQAKNVAYNSLSVLAAPNLRKKLSQFKKGVYGKSDIQISFYQNCPNWVLESRSFNDISQDEEENIHERKIIGELATRMAFFSYGYSGVPTQDNSGQGIDGIYLQRNEGGQLIAMFLTESKCQNAHISTQIIMDTQLNERILYGNIGRLEKPHKTMILDFIDHTPAAVFKAAHRVLINGSSEWLVKPLNANAFQSLRRGISSPERDKEAFIATISHNFRSPEEMLRVLFSHYNADSDQKKLAIFNRALEGPIEPLEELVSTTNRQGSEESKVAKRLSFGPRRTEQSRDIEKSEQLLTYQEEKSEYNDRLIENIECNRKNLSKLLSFIKSGFKRSQLKEINEGLSSVGSDYSLKAPQLSQLSDYKKYPTFHNSQDYTFLWDLLLVAFKDQYQQAIAERVFEEED